MNGNKLRKELTETKAAGKIAVAIGIYDARTAKLLSDTAKEMKRKDEMPSHIGMVLPFISGYLVSASLGYPDMAIIDRSIMGSRVGEVSTAIRDVPFGADVDTGFGNSSYAMAITAKQMHNAGAAYLQLEDQDGDKTCGHMEGSNGTGKQVLPADVFAYTKLKPMVDYARANAKGDLMIMARTDSLNVPGCGLEDAMGRAGLYSRLGAELIFIESPLDDGQLETIAQGFKDHKDRFNLANMIEGSPKTPYHNHKDLQEMGFDIALYCIGLGFTEKFNKKQEEGYIRAILSGEDPMEKGIVPSNAFNRFNSDIGKSLAEKINTTYLDELRHQKQISPDNFVLV